MRFIWPIKADYRIIDLDPDYQTVIIGRQKLWVMARSPEVDDATWRRLEQKVADAGYDQALLRRDFHVSWERRYYWPRSARFFAVFFGL